MRLCIYALCICIFTCRPGPGGEVAARTLPELHPRLCGGGRLRETSRSCVTARNRVTDRHHSTELRHGLTSRACVTARITSRNTVMSSQANTGRLPGIRRVRCPGVHTTRLRETNCAEMRRGLSRWRPGGLGWLHRGGWAFGEVIFRQEGTVL